MPAPQADNSKFLEEFGAKSAIFAGMGGGILGYRGIFEFQAFGVSMKVG